MEGAAGIARSIDRRYPAKNIRILPVPMRIEDAESARLDAGRSLARARFDRFPQNMEEGAANAYWHAVEIPYRTLYAYEEMLAAFGDPPGSPSSLLSAYERLASAIVERPIALEPMECMANAFNRPDCAQAIRLLPGAERRFRCGVEVELS